MTYPGEKDYILHFNKYLKAFKDKRYITVDGKLLFVIFAPMDMPDFPQFKKFSIGALMVLILEEALEQM